MIPIQQMIRVCHPRELGGKIFQTYVPPVKRAASKPKSVLKIRDPPPQKNKENSPSLTICETYKYHHNKPAAETSPTNQKKVGLPVVSKSTSESLEKKKELGRLRGPGQYQLSTKFASSTQNLVGCIFKKQNIESILIQEAARKVYYPAPGQYKHEDLWKKFKDHSRTRVRSMDVKSDNRSTQQRVNSNLPTSNNKSLANVNDSLIRSSSVKQTSNTGLQLDESLNKKPNNKLVGFKFPKEKRVLTMSAPNESPGPAIHGEIFLQNSKFQHTSKNFQLDMASHVKKLNIYYH